MGELEYCSAPAQCAPAATAKAPFLRPASATGPDDIPRCLATGSHVAALSLAYTTMSPAMGKRRKQRMS